MEMPSKEILLKLYRDLIGEGREDENVRNDRGQDISHRSPGSG